ncbi:MAG: hypothetical protein KDI71_19705, partial [Xanthomonadales bacterium]|nr:hypothetical protein [Xanthomonadales bacterium]
MSTLPASEISSASGPEDTLNRSVHALQSLFRARKKTVVAVIALLSSAIAYAATFVLSTPYNTNNGQRGAMFDITATNSVIIRNIDANLYSGTTADYEIYYRAGTHVGFENNAAAWTLLGTTTALTSLGTDVPTPIPITLDLLIPAGQTYALYVTNTFGGGTSYTDGAAVGNFLAGDANISVFEGVGKSYPFGLTFTVRKFNGTFHYDLADLQVAVSPTPATVAAPGGPVSYAVQLSNLGINTVSVTSLTDSLLGSLDGVGTCALPQTLAPSTNYNCSFTTNVTGTGGTTVTRTISAAGTAAGNPVSASAMASVDIIGAAAMTVTKTATPNLLPEPGGNVTFGVSVANTGSLPIDLATLVDDVHGNLAGQGTCTLPQVIAVAATYSCSFTAMVVGNAGFSEVDTITASGMSGGSPISAQGSATVTLTDVPSSLSLTKTATPTSVDEPGGLVSFSVQVNNTSAVDSITINSLIDDIHGDLNGQGTCAVPQVIPAGGSYSCAFSATVTGNAGDTEIDTITAAGTDDDANPISANGSATVTINDLPASMNLVKVATPTSVDEPGGSVSFAVQVNNTSAVDSITINS